MGNTTDTYELYTSMDYREENPFCVMTVLHFAHTLILSLVLHMYHIYDHSNLNQNDDKAIAGKTSTMNRT